MNNCNFIGRLTKDPGIRVTAGENAVHIARFTIAVDRPRKGNDGQTDYLPCKAIGAKAEFSEKYLRKGQQIGIRARAVTGSYEKDGSRVYYTEFIVEEFTFCGSRATEDGFMNIPEGTEDELPFN